MTVIAATNRAGRVFRQVRRCLVANDGKPVVIAQLLAYCYPRDSRHPRWHYRNIYRCLRRYAVPIGRLQCGSGRAILWAPNAELRRLINPSS
jgi:hypothetical protein